MTLLEWREQIRAAIEASVQPLQLGISVLAHPGRFDQGELKRVAARAPAVFVAFLQVKRVEVLGGETLADVRVGLFVVTKDRSQGSRDELALAIIQQMADLIADNRWNADAASNPGQISFANLWSGNIASLGTAMWAGDFEQKLTITGPVDPATLSAFLTYHADHDLEPGNDEPTATDELTLPQ